jgi:hypothetical protein
MEKYPSPVTEAVVVPLGVHVLPAEFVVLQLGPDTCVVGVLGMLVMSVHVMVCPGASITWTCMFDIVAQLDGITVREH